MARRVPRIAGVVIVVGLAAGLGTARADVIDHRVKQLERGDYKVRMSAVLSLSKNSSDPRAIKSLAKALTEDSERTIRKLAAMSLRKLGPNSPGWALRLAVRALTHAAKHDRDRAVRKAARTALATLRPRKPRRSSRSFFVEIGRPTDATKRLSSSSNQAVASAVRSTLSKLAPEYSLKRPRRHTGKGFFVGPRVTRLTVKARGNLAKVSCSLSMALSPWSSKAGKQRLMDGSAQVTGNATVTTSRRGVRQASHECVVTVAQELTRRQVVPFLRRHSQGIRTASTR